MKNKIFDLLNKWQTESNSIDKFLRGVTNKLDYAELVGRSIRLNSCINDLKKTLYNYKRETS